MSARRTQATTTLSASDLQQRVIRVPRAAFFPPPDRLFDLWHQGRCWAAKIRSEPCTCGRPGRPHRHRYIEGGELHAGLDWRVGAQLSFRVEGDRIVVDGDLQG